MELKSKNHPRTAIYEQQREWKMMIVMRRTTTATSESHDHKDFLILKTREERERKKLWRRDNVVALST
jgi:hypothetical protein